MKLIISVLALLLILECVSSLPKLPNMKKPKTHGRKAMTNETREKLKNVGDNIIIYNQEL